MNERVQILFVEAFGYQPSPIGEPDVERLIKLVVNECAELVSEDRRIYWEMARDVAQDIRNHFGVTKEVDNNSG